MRYINFPMICYNRHYIGAGWFVTRFRKGSTVYRSNNQFEIDHQCEISVKLVWLKRCRSTKLIPPCVMWKLTTKKPEGHWTLPGTIWPNKYWLICSSWFIKILKSKCLLMDSIMLAKKHPAKVNISKIYFSFWLP